MHSKYFTLNCILDFPPKRGASYLYENIVRAWAFLKDGFHWTLGNGYSSFWNDVWCDLGWLCTLVVFVHISDSNALVRDVWREGDVWHEGAWFFDNLSTIIPPDLHHRISKVPIPAAVDHDDGWIWGSNSGVYFVAIGYQWLLERSAIGHGFGKLLHLRRFESYSSSCYMMVFPPICSVSFVIFVLLPFARGVGWRLNLFCIVYIIVLLVEIFGACLVLVMVISFRLIGYRLGFGVLCGRTQATYLSWLFGFFGDDGIWLCLKGTLV